MGYLEAAMTTLLSYLASKDRGTAQLFDGVGFITIKQLVSKSKEMSNFKEHIFFVS